MYVTGSSKSGTAVVFAYDIFGWTPNVEQVADRLASLGGHVVVVPDFMRGQPWPASNVPVTKDGAFPEGVTPGDGVETLFGWIMGNDNCKTDRVDEISKIKDYLAKEHGIIKMGMTGFCWGAKVAFVAAGKKVGLVDAV